jgi:phage terminase large subunit-like protein
VITVTLVSALPQASVTMKVRVLGPTTGLKQTISPLSVPPNATLEDILLSTSVAVKPGRQIWLKSQTNMVWFDGLTATGVLFKVTVITVTLVSALPQASVTIKDNVFGPTTGLKQTVSPLRVPPNTILEDILLSTSVAVNPGRQIWLRSQTNIVWFDGLTATGALLRETVITVMLVSAAPQASVAISFRVLVPIAGVKQAVSP